MSDNSVSDRPRPAAAEILPWPAASLDELRDALFVAATGGGFTADFAITTFNDVATVVAAGHFIDAGRIPRSVSFDPIMADVQAALKAGRLPIPRPAVPIAYSVSDAADDQTLLLLLSPPSEEGGQLLPLVATLSVDRRVNLVQPPDLSETVNQQLLWVAFALCYLSDCKAAVETVTHHSGISYSRLDVAKAIRIKEAEKATDVSEKKLETIPIEPGDGPRPLSLGQARRELTENLEADFRLVSYRGEVAGGLLEASRQAKAGRLFVADNVPLDLVNARLDDTKNAIKSGILRPPFPATFVLASLEGLSGAYLMGVFDSGFVDDEARCFGLRCWAVMPCRLSDGRVAWGSPDRRDAPSSLSNLAIAFLGLIADSHVPVQPIQADAALNKARVKRGKAPIPPYWRIEPPKPTVLVPNVAPAVATKPKGGTHASPRPHDRRGHPRNLKGGRTVWVRDCKINALIPHLTRDRSYYEVRL